MKRFVLTVGSAAVILAAMIGVVLFRDAPADDGSETRISSLETRVSNLEAAVGISPSPTLSPTRDPNATVEVDYAQDGNTISVKGTGEELMYLGVHPGEYVGNFTCETGDKREATIWTGGTGDKMAPTVFLPGVDTPITFHVDSPNQMWVRCDGPWTFEAHPG